MAYNHDMEKWLRWSREGKPRIDVNKSMEVVLNGEVCFPAELVDTGNTELIVIRHFNHQVNHDVFDRYGTHVYDLGNACVQFHEGRKLRNSVSRIEAWDASDSSGVKE